jgi:hypothetical protein
MKQTFRLFKIFLIFMALLGGNIQYSIASSTRTNYFSDIPTDNFNYLNNNSIDGFQILQNPPRNFAAEVIGQNIHFTWDTPTGEPIDELIYDNNILSGTYANDGYTMASHMSPSQACKILKLKYYTKLATPLYNDFDPKVFDWAGDEPGTTVLYQSTADAVNDAWMEVDISAQNILVSGDFMVGFGSTTTGVYLGYNENGNGRSWDYNGGSGTWSSWDDTYFIRAIVEYTGGKIAELSPVETTTISAITQGNILEHQEGSHNNQTIEQISDNGSRALLGYNMYRDNIKLNESIITGQFYDDLNVEPGTYNYTCTAVYSDGESTPSEQVQLTIVPGDVFYMQDNAVTTCDALFYDSGGPEDNYENLEDYTLTMTPTTLGTKINVVFTSFASEYNYDVLRVYDGDNISAPIIGSFSGFGLPPEIVASDENTSGAITFRFTSDGSNNEGGWNANISCAGGPVTLYSTDFETYTNGIQIACQDSVHWTTKNDSPCGPEDAYINTTVAHSPVKSVFIENATDLALIMSENITGIFELDFSMYVPSGYSGYYNVLQEFAATTSIPGLEAYFHTDGTGIINAGGTGIASFNFNHNQWLSIKNVIDLNNDLAELFIDNVSVHSWQWSLGATGLEGILQLSASGFQAISDPNHPSDVPMYYIDDVSYIQVTAPDVPNIIVTHDSFNLKLEPNTTAVRTLTIANTGDATLDYNIGITYPVRSAERKGQAENGGIKSLTEINSNQHLPAKAKPAYIPSQTTKANNKSTSFNRSIVYVDQTGNPSAESGIYSQTMSDYPSYSNAGADDFTVPSGATWEIDHVYVNGSFPYTPTVIPGIDIIFYSDASGYPGTAITTYTNIACESQESGIINITLPTPTTLTAGLYWISVAPNMDLTYGFWVWNKEVAPTIGNEYKWQNPGGGYESCTSWCDGSLQFSGIDNNLSFALSNTTLIPPQSEWLIANPLTGSVPAGSSVDVEVTFDANGLVVGNYDGLLTVNSNDLTQPVIDVAAGLEVKFFGALPFHENWASADFENNGWSFFPGQGNWVINTTYGNYAPSAAFDWGPRDTSNYSYALVSPVMLGTGITDNITLKYDIELDSYATTTIEGMSVEVFDGTEWNVIQNYTNANGSFSFISEMFDITSLAAGHDFRVRFRAHGDDTFNINHWYLDNVKIYQRVLGNLNGTITKLSDGTPVQDASIILNNPISGIVSATSGANGIYSIMDAESGIYALELQKAGFNTVIDTITIIGNQTVTADYALTAPGIGVDPDSLSVTVPLGDSTIRTVNITNSGNGPMYWRGSIHSNTQRNPISASDGKFPRGNGRVSIDHAPVNTPIQSKASNGRVYNNAYAFNIYPGNNFFSFNPNDPENQNVISTINYATFCGTFDAVHNGYMYIIDYSNNMLKKVDVATGTLTDVGFCTPINSGHSWTGISVDKSSNIMYGISTDMLDSYLYTIDMTTASVTIIGPTGIPTAIDIAIDGAGQMYTYDITNDESFIIDKVTGASTLLGSIGFDGNYAQGMGWDPDSDIIYLAAYNFAVENSELRILDRATGNTSIVGNLGGSVDGLAFPGGGEGSMARIEPVSGTIPAGSSQSIDVIFNGSYIPPQRDMVVHGVLDFTTAPNAGPAEVDLVMTIAGALNGILEGTVSHDGISIEGATITATRQEVPVFTYTMETDTNGMYIFQDAIYGTYDFTAVKPGFNPFSSTGVAVLGDQTTVYDISMLAPELIITPLSITDTTPAGTIRIRSIAISNTGDGELSWTAAINTAEKVTSIPASNGKFPMGTAAVSFERAPAGISMPSNQLSGNGNTGYAFEISPGNLFFSFESDEPAIHNIISSIGYSPFGGTFDAINTNFMYVIDFNTNELMKIDIATGGVTVIGNCEVYPGEFWMGITVDKTTNIMYGISTNITESHIYTIDMETAITSLIGATGIPGAIDVTIDGEGQMYSFDIVNNESFAIDKTTGTSTLLGSIGFDANFSQGMGWDPEADIVYLAAYNNSNNQGELRILDRVTGNTTIVGGMGGEIDGLAFPGGLPSWLSIGSLNGSINPGETLEIPVYLDATDLIDGTYTGSITFVSNPDVGSVSVPVTLVVGNTLAEPMLSIDSMYSVSAGPVSVPVDAIDLKDLSFFQFTLDYDASKLTYTGTSNWYTGITDVLIESPTSGKLTFVWETDAESVTINQGTFFNIDFVFNGSLELAPIEWSDDPTQREFGDSFGNYIVPAYYNGFVTGKPVGIVESEESTATIYPNPASDNFTIKLNNQNIVEVNMYNSMGIRVYNNHDIITSGIFTIPVQHLPAGNYILKVTGINETFVKTVILK